MVLEKTLESPLDYNEIKLVHPKGNQSQIFIGRTDTEAEAPILWPPEVKSQLIGTDPDAGKDWRWEEKGMTEDEMVGCYQWLDGHEFEQALGVGEGQGSLVCCRLWGCKESDTTEQLNLTELIWLFLTLFQALLVTLETFLSTWWTLWKGLKWMISFILHTFCILSEVSIWSLKGHIENPMNP